MKRLFTTVFVATWCLVAAWLGGVDFDSRGAGVFFTFLYTSAFSILTYTYPGWDK